MSSYFVIIHYNIYNRPAKWSDFPLSRQILIRITNIRLYPIKQAYMYIEDLNDPRPALYKKRKHLSYSLVKIVYNYMMVINIAFALSERMGKFHTVNCQTVHPGGGGS